MKKQFRIVVEEGTILQLVLAMLTGMMLIVTPATGHAYQISQSASQPESRDPYGRITVEASVIHVVTCNGAGENGGQFYIYQYVNRPGFRAIHPPDWGHAIGGGDYPSFEQAVGVACGGDSTQGQSRQKTGPTTPNTGSGTGPLRCRDGSLAILGVCGGTARPRAPR